MKLIRSRYLSEGSDPELYLIFPLHLAVDNIPACGRAYLKNSNYWQMVDGQQPTCKFCLRILAGNRKVSTSFLKEAPEKSTRIDYKKYISSAEWREKSNSAKARAGYRCQVCNSRFKLVAHHRTYKNLGHESPDDLTVLCRECHNFFETQKLIPRPTDVREYNYE